jgi:hypothetical protein
MRVAASEDVAFQRLLQHREQEQVEFDVDVDHRAHARHRAGTGLRGHVIAASTISPRISPTAMMTLSAIRP